MEKTRKKETDKDELPLEDMFIKQPTQNSQGQNLDWTGRLEKKKKVARFIDALLHSGWHLNKEAFYTTARMSNRTFARIIDSANTKEIPTEFAFNRIAIAVLCLLPDLCKYLSKQRLLDKGSIPHGVAKLSVKEESMLREEYIATFGPYGAYFADNVEHYEDLLSVLDFQYRQVDTRNRKKKENTQHHHSELS